MIRRLRSSGFRGFLIVALFLAFTEFVIAQSPQSPPADQTRSRLQTGIRLYSQGKWPEAVLELRRLQAEATTNAQRAEALFWISMSEISAGEYDQALQDMDALEAADPANRRVAELPYQRGRALYNLGRYSEAIVLLKGYADSLTPGGGVVLSPADTSRKAAALYWTGECLYSMGQLDKAADVFTGIVQNYPGCSKYEASRYRLDLIEQKKVENELLGLLKWSHEESLKNMEEYRRREAAYDQALGAYQKRIADMLKDTRLKDLEDENSRYKDQLDAAQQRISSLEGTLKETSATLEKVQDSATVERLKTLKASAQDLESKIAGQDGNRQETGK